MPAEGEKIPTWDPNYIRDISEAVYRIELGGKAPTDAERMVAKDGDGGVKLRNRAGFYDALTRTYLEVLGHKPGDKSDATK
jgi:hypothetical protein